MVFTALFWFCYLNYPSQIFHLSQGALNIKIMPNALIELWMAFPIADILACLLSLLIINLAFHSRAEANRVSHGGNAK